MDDRRFDSLAKALAEGKSRRTVLKGLLGLGGAALAGSVALDDDSEAARRPSNPTPTPVRCPGGQTYNPVTRKCDCPAGLSQCAPNGGPACCNDGIAVGPGYSECCDNACCFWPNDCVGEELCCPRLPEVGCLDAQGGCCTTLCGVTPDGPVCCPVEDFCPGGSTSPDLCCPGNETCCGGGTNDNYCADFSTGGCCDAGDCPDPGEGECGFECVARQCEPTICPEGQICCQGDCVSSSEFSACPVDPEGCCSTVDGFVCCGDSGCCLSTHCNEVNGDCCATEEAVCRVEGGCCTPPQECCLGETCCDPGSCATTGCCIGDNIVCGPDCCPEIRCGINAVTGGPACCPEEFIACDTVCCKASIYQCNAEGTACECLPGTEGCGLLPGGCCPDGKCNDLTGECCDVPGESPCGETCCLDAQCNDDSVCCPENTTACGEDCCNDATETCNVASGACECNSNTVLCNGVCTLAECCAGEFPADHCQTQYGYDTECVTCPFGFCVTSSQNGFLCHTDDFDELGKCADGFCIPCGGGANAPCEFDEDCCSNFCEDDGQCSDP